jgi:ribosome-associated protein
MSEKTQKIIINKQPVELCKLLKIANLVSGGGEAKIVITQGYVVLNGEVEFQKRKKIIDGDIIEFNGESVVVVYQVKKTDVITTKTNKKIKPKKNKDSVNEEKIEPLSSVINNSDQNQKNIQTRKKRKAIKF